MKKFLSLVLALIMTMSLVTISAGATEYRDLTDKDEIQYEEAVAVLNRIGVITGYEDGSFRPETELTRGAAAKIIVSLMIGPEAASALPNNASPYPDVPAGHTFAGVIGYCKTAGYISGYGDGTFKPANPLTGYAFAKMLLGAIGYKSNIEGFVDTGWTMNVARIGNVAGLFDRISFDGAKAVTRDEACQLALNTLKATMVDYGSANTVVSSSGEVLTVQGSKAVYVTSNNRDINANINRRVISATNNELTLEFGEEHFKDLRLEHDRYDPAYDVYGHPSNEWSYKKVTIGTFKLPADFTFTKQMAHIEDTVATKEKALGLRGYDTYSTDHRGGYVNWSTAASSQYAASPFADATQIHINGWEARVRNTELYKQTDVPKGETDKKGVWYSYDARSIGSANKTLAPTLSEICDLTDNGVTVEVYVCPVDADFITDVVVTRTQLMEIDRVASDYVELDTISSDSKDPYKTGSLSTIAGYNDYSLQDGVVSVKDNNYDAYNVLKDLKSGDEVAVIPYTSDNGKTWEVGEAYVPETVSGALTNVDIYNTNQKPDGNAIAITVGGTTYPIAQWNKDMREISGTKIRATKKDVTLLLDKMGNAMLAKDVGNSNSWIIVGDYYQAAGASGRVNWFVHGWTIKGDEVDLELSSIRGAAEKYAPGELVKYDIASQNNGEYELYKPNYNQLAVWKNGKVADWTEPTGAVKDNVQTGEGIYNISQFARQNLKDGTVGDAEYEIKSVNTLLPLEFYNTNSKDVSKSVEVKGDHFNYEKATTTAPSTIVGSDTAANPPECGILTGAKGFYGTTMTTATTDVGTQVTGGKYDEWSYRTAPYDGVKFIYVGFDANGEVEVINFMDGVQNVSYKELIQINRAWKNVGTNNGDFVASPAEAYVDKDGKVKAVVIKSDSAEANLKDLKVIVDNRGANTSTKGGAEAPTSGTYYTRQYVSGEDGFKEEKTGYFDKALLVGDVVTGTVQANGIIRAKYFHTNDYTNRNPDGIYVKGIAPLKTEEGSKVGNAFYVGPKADELNDVKGATKALGNGVTGSRVLSLTEDNCDILSGKDVLGVNDGTDKKGLIKVDGTTQFIDLRSGRPGGIDEIGDLFDLNNNANIELKLIVNGNPNSDGFRHAYAILILNAGTGASKAEAPKFDTLVDGKVASKVNAAKGDELELSVRLTNLDDLTDVSYSWDIDQGRLDGDKKSDTVTFTPKSEGTYKVTVTVTNKDTDKDIETNPVKKTIEITVGGVAGKVTSTVVDRDRDDVLKINTGNATVLGTGKVQWFANVNVLADWAVLSATPAITDLQSMDYNIKVDGSTITAVTGRTFAATPTTGSVIGATAAVNKSFNLTGIEAVGLLPGSDVSIEITKLVFANVVVEFKSGDTAVITDWVVKGADTSNKLTHGGADLSLALDTKSSDADVMANVKFTTEGLTTNVETAKAVAGFSSGKTTALTGATCTPAQDGPVVVTLTGLGSLTKADPTYSITSAIDDLLDTDGTGTNTGVAIEDLGVGASDANSDAVLSILNATSGDALVNLPSANSVALQAKITKAAGLGSGQVGYLVTVVVDGKTLTGVCTASNTAVDLEPASGSKWITMDAEKAISSVTVTPIAKVTPGTITHTTGTAIYTIEMAAATEGSASDGGFLAADFAITASTSNADFVGADCEGTTIVLQLSKELVTGEKIGLTATIKNANDPANSDGATAAASTLQADGTWSSWA